MVRIVYSTCKQFGITSGAVEIACDGESALFHSFASNFLPTPKGKHYDILSEIKALISDCAITWRTRHVRSHQDETRKVLDFWEEHNCRMDKLAKEEWSRSQGREHFNHDGLLDCAAWIGDERLTGEWFPGWDAIPEPRYLPVVSDIIVNTQTGTGNRIEFWDAHGTPLPSKGKIRRYIDVGRLTKGR